MIDHEIVVNEERTVEQNSIETLHVTITRLEDAIEELRKELTRERKKFTELGKRFAETNEVFEEFNKDLSPLDRRNICDFKTIGLAVRWMRDKLKERGAGK